MDKNDWKEFFDTLRQTLSDCGRMCVTCDGTSPVIAWERFPRKYYPTLVTWAEQNDIYYEEGRNVCGERTITFYD